ncbi:peptide deformylase [Candidatus Avelusimicrobium luingense]|uniref:peptide deformylase n=1 Tax=Candidatus Avelusimicrobium luingense TaxID=3416211 RepID=UPI003D142C15
MAILRITKYGEPVLRQKLKPVNYDEIAPQLPQLLKDMEETCLSVRGVGLAANQIGLPLRLAVILLPGEKEDDPPTRYVIINPQIISKRGEKIEEEGCLSLPGLWADVPRATDVTVTYLDENGQEHTKRARGLLAKAFQHEVDHLDGKLFIDLIDPKNKPEVKKIIKKLRNQWD